MYATLFLAVHLLAAKKAAAPPPRAPQTLVRRVKHRQLENVPVIIAFPLGGDLARQVQDVARDPKRRLVMVVDGIVKKQPGIVYDVKLSRATRSSGTLAFDHVAADGRFEARFPIDDAADEVLSSGHRTLLVFFAPQGRHSGEVSFTELRLVEE
ncbi:MAG TPA: hypothetical protein VF824_21625 [Thermoanaerobaculia bacterium]|jgi:hypothetical protein